MSELVSGDELAARISVESKGSLRGIRKLRETRARAKR